MAVVAIEADLANRRASLTASVQWFERSARAVQVLSAHDSAGARALGKLAMGSFGADSFVLADAQGVVLVRAEDGERRGESVAQLDTVRAALAGKAAVALEAPTQAELVLRGATPVYDSQNNLVGVAALGYVLSQNSYVDRLKVLLDAEVTVFGGSTRLVTTLTDDAGKRLAGTKLGNPVIEEQVLVRGEPYFGTNRIRGNSYSTVYLPVKDEGRRIVGMVFAGLSLASVDRSVVTLTLSFTGLSLFVLALTVTFLVLYLQRRVIGPLVLTAQDLERMSEGRRPLVDEVRARRLDEIGTMSRSLQSLGEYLADGGQVATEISQGNLAVEPRVAGPEDQFGLAFSSMTTELNSLIRHIRQASHEVAEGIHQIAEGTQVLSSGATENAASLEQMEASLTEIVKASEDNAKEAQTAARLSEEVNRTGQSSQQEMEAFLTAMGAVEASARDIQSVVKTIDDIAFQVNLLALNANIEAARAGKYGKGFGVVAEEVRSLAKRSTDAVGDTRKMMGEIQGRIAAGSATARTTGGHLAEMVAGLEKITGVLALVSERSRRQSETLVQLNEGMSHLSQVTQTNAATAEQSASVTQQLQAVASDLEETTRRFLLRDEASSR